MEALDLSIESEDEEEDEVGELVTGEVASEFLEVYTRIRDQDPALYDSATQFFKEEGQVAPEVLQAKALAKAAKPEKRNPLLEAAIIRGEDEEDEDLDAVKRAEQQLSYVEQQDALKREFKEALAEADVGDDLLEEKKRSPDEQVTASSGVRFDHVLTMGPKKGAVRRRVQAVPGQEKARKAQQRR